MKRYAFYAVAASMLIFTACRGEGVASKSELATEQDKFSYAIGTDIGMSLKDFKGEVDLAVMFQGIKDHLEDKPALLNEADNRAIKETVFKRIAEVKQQEELAKAETNKTTGEKFLADNGKKSSVKTTASGLQYEVIKEGAGAKPAATDMVKVHYVGTTIAGKEFDSSIKRGEPVTFPVGQVIPGWTEALQLMSVGSKYKLFIPSTLAYGERSAGPDIGPNETLIFEVELLEINPAAAAPAGGAGGAGDAASQAAAQAALEAALKGAKK